MISQLTAVVVLAACGLVLAACASPGGGGGRGAGDAGGGSAGSVAAHRPGAWAIVIHGGAGTIDRGSPPERLAAYRAAMGAALALGTRMLAEGRESLDVCEAVVRYLEDDPLFNAGRGAVYTEVGEHELDASVMRGRDLACGAVAGVRTIKNPISLARLVMEKSGHVLLIGEGAERFGAAHGVETVPNSYFDTPQRYEQLQRKLRERAKQSAAVDATPARAGDPRDRFGTVGCVALDGRGDLAAATSTGGMTAKRFGRVGDTPIIGAGCFADNRSAAVSCTGTGEEFIRHTVARDIAALVEFKGWPLGRAAEFVVHQRLAKDDGGIIAVSRSGEIAMVFNCEGMYRAAGDSSGRREVGIFEEMVPVR